MKECIYFNLYTRRRAVKQEKHKSKRKKMYEKARAKACVVVACRLEKYSKTEEAVGKERK